MSQKAKFAKKARRSVTQDEWMRSLLKASAMNAEVVATLMRNDRKGILALRAAVLLRKLELHFKRRSEGNGDGTQGGTAS